jgi:hypothetical protein
MLKDVVWAYAPDETRIVSDFEPKTFYNLFDGIVTLTHVLARDEWIRKTFAL